MLLDKIKEKYKNAILISDVLWGITFSLEDYPIDTIFEQGGMIAVKHNTESQAFKVLYDIEDDEYAEIVK